jgi:phosphatidylglycerophosphatase C
MRREAAVGWRRATGLVALLAAAPLAVIAAQRSRAIRLVVRAALLGVTCEDLMRRTQTFGTALAHEPGRVLRAGVAAVHRHVAIGDRVVLVTASEETLARSFLHALGLTTVEPIASRVRGSAIEVHSRGEEKVRQLATYGITPPWQVAYGDSLTDLPILQGAQHAVQVNAKPRDLARARHPGRPRHTGEVGVRGAQPGSAREVRSSSIQCGSTELDQLLGCPYRRSRHE